MTWLIVEDALRDRKGHWLEYVTTFRAGLLELGDEVTILAPRDAEPFVVQGLDAQPVLPRSIWHRMNDGAGALTRLARIPAHWLATWSAMKRHFARHGYPDIIFVPTISVHHLGAWWRLLAGPLRRRKTRTLLYFLESPIHRDAESGRAALRPNVTARIFRRLVRAIGPAVKDGRVALAAETVAMSNALQEVTGVPFAYLPQPVPAPPASRLDARPRRDGEILMAAYGPARHEKGSDVLQAAIARYLVERPGTKARFVIQWIDDFQDGHGHQVSRNPTLLQDPRVEYLGRYFAEGEYGTWLARTAVMLLPYRSSYALRGSRVTLEAMVHGIPIVATRGTTLAQQAEQFGAVVQCEDGSVEGLCDAIRQAEDNYTALHDSAIARAASAAEHFSVRTFRRMLLDDFSR
jgi:glycosyltransferase involved in cell wall biosynthesis